MRSLAPSLAAALLLVVAAVSCSDDGGGDGVSTTTDDTAAVLGANGLPDAWNPLTCGPEHPDAASGAWTLLGAPASDGAFDAVIYLTVLATAADREVGADEQPGITMVDIGADRPQARMSQDSVTGVTIDWFDTGHRVAISAPPGHGDQALAAARALTVDGEANAPTIVLGTVDGLSVIASDQWLATQRRSSSCQGHTPEAGTLLLMRGGPRDAPPNLSADTLTPVVVGGIDGWAAALRRVSPASASSQPADTCAVAWPVTDDLHATVVAAQPCAELRKVAGVMAEAFAG